MFQWGMLFGDVVELRVMVVASSGEHVTRCFLVSRLFRGFLGHALVTIVLGFLVVSLSFGSVLFPATVYLRSRDTFAVVVAPDLVGSLSKLACSFVVHWLGLMLGVLGGDGFCCRGIRGMGRVLFFQVALGRVLFFVGSLLRRSCDGDIFVGLFSRAGEPGQGVDGTQ